MTEPWSSPIPLPERYSADLVRSDGVRIRVAIDGPLCRVENDLPGLIEGITISRPDLGLMVSISSANRTYRQIKWKVDPRSPAFDPEANIEWRHVGDESIDGRACDVYEARIRGAGRPHEVCSVDRATRLRLRVVTLDLLGRPALTVDCTNIDLGPPDPSLFEVPPGYQRVR